MLILFLPIFVAIFCLCDFIAPLMVILLRYKFPYLTMGRGIMKFLKKHFRARDGFR